MRTLVITDLHLHDSPRGLLDSQVDALLDVFKKENLTRNDGVIMMGDIFMKRRPSPSVLLGFKKVVDYLEFNGVYSTIIRGNHDSETKADDGVTALSLFRSPSTQVVTHTWFDYKTKRAFIPHYENEERIVTSLEEVPKGYTVFGHFGYFGSLNSMGDADFTIDCGRFRNNSYLGHIHGFHQKQVGEVTLTVLGTPYTTNFTEAGKDSYYAVFERSHVLGEDTVEFKTLSKGPKHIVLDYDNIKDDELLDNNYFKIVRVYVNKLSDSDNHLIAKELLEKYSIDCLEIKYKPIFEGDEENYYSPTKELFSLSQEMLTNYVDNSAVSIDKDYILSGLNMINNAYKEN